MAAYYNEVDENKVAWLRELIKAGIIAPGDVDDRSIKDVQPADLLGYEQCHFFAGIGIWSYALRLAGWPDQGPVWTGSCPCPSFSAAGKGAGFDDPRHLWPDWARLIRECKPPAILGEQVDDAIGFGWLDLVQTDLEAEAYAVGKAVLGACSVGAPHIRQRLWFVALGDTERGRLERQPFRQSASILGTLDEQTGPRSATGSSSAGIDGMEHSFQSRLEGHHRHGDDCDESRWIGTGAARPVAETGELGSMGEPMLPQRRPVDVDGRDGCDRQDSERKEALSFPGASSEVHHIRRPGPVNGFWRDADWLFCRDGKWRPVRPGSFPLAHGAATRILRLRGYGDGINAEVAKVFIQSVMSDLNSNKRS